MKVDLFTIGVAVLILVSVVISATGNVEAGGFIVALVGGGLGLLSGVNWLRSRKKGHNIDE